jgi:dTMP kinase
MMGMERRSQGEPKRRGRLISFEGLDGSGKTTQMHLLEQWFQSRALSYVRTREPGGTPLGKELRQLLLHRPDLVIAPLAEVFLFQADRAQHFTSVILPALATGTHVITDRCLDSSIAYQGIARGVGAALVEQLSLIATGGLVPDLTILLDLDPRLASTRTARAQDRSGESFELTRFDREQEQFHQRLRQAFLMLAHTYPERIKVIDAMQSPQQIYQQIIAQVEPLLNAS